MFEAIETEEVKDVKQLRNVLDYYREQGFSVALGDLGSGYSLFKMIRILRPGFIKLNMQLNQEVCDDLHKAAVA